MGVAILISDRETLVQRQLSGRKSGITYDKGSIPQENIIILKVYGPSNTASTYTTNYIRQKLIKFQGKICEYALIFADFNIPLRNG